MDKELVLAYSEKTDNRGVLEDHQGAAEVREPGCDDLMRMYLKTHREIITELCYTISETACPPVKACAARVAEMAIGKPVMEAYLITSEELSRFFGTFPKESYHCALMAELTLKKALQDYAARRAGRMEKRQM